MSLAKYLARAGEGAEKNVTPGLLKKLKFFAEDHPGMVGAGLGAAGGVAADEALSEDDDPIKKLLKKIGLG